MLSVKPSPEKTTRPGMGQAPMSLMVAGIFSSFRLLGWGN